MISNKKLDIQIEKSLKAYLDSVFEDEVDYQKFHFYSIVTHSTSYPEGDTVNTQLHIVK